MTDRGSPSGVRRLRGLDGATLWTLALEDDGIAITRNENDPREIQPSEVVLYARRGQRIAFAFAEEIVAFDVEREWDPSGRWRTSAGAVERLFAHLEGLPAGQELTKQTITRFSDAQMPAIARALIGLQLAFWPFVAALDAAGRLPALERLALAWPEAHKDYQHVQYARLYFLLQAGRVDEVRRILVEATVERWPYLYRPNDRLNDEPNLFAEVGLHAQAVIAFRGGLADPEHRKYTSGWGLARIAADLAFSYLALGQREAAEDALVEARLLDSGSLQAYVESARFRLLTGDKEAAVSWIHRAAAHLAVPRRGATSLSGMAEARNDPQDLVRELAHRDFATLGDELGSLLQRQPTAKEVAAIRSTRRRLATLHELHAEAAQALEQQGWQRAITVLRKAVASAKQGSELGHLTSQLTAELAQALQSSGGSSEALEVLDAAASRGASSLFSLRMAHVLVEFGRKEDAEHWLDRAERVAPDQARTLEIRELRQRIGKR